MDDRDANDEFEAITSGQEMSRGARLQTGELRVEDLDDEELYRGQCRDRNGRFTGGKRDMVPRAMIVEWQRRLRQGAQNRLDGNLLAFTDALVKIALDKSESTSDRLVAIRYGMDRILGKTPERVELAVSQKPYEALLAVDGGIFRRIPDEPRPDVAVEIEDAETGA